VLRACRPLHNGDCLERWNCQNLVTWFPASAISLGVLLPFAPASGIRPRHYRGTFVKRAVSYCSWALAALVSTACVESDQTPVSPSLEQSRSSATVALRNETLDETFARHARAVPEFAGMWIDSAGRLIINVTAASAASQAAAELAPFITEVRSRSPQLAGTTQFRVVSYDYASLQRWRELIFADLGASVSMLTLDIDETKAEIEIGVPNVAADSPTIAAYLQQKRIPQGAVRVAAAAPVLITSGASTVLTSSAVTHQHLNLSLNPMPAGIVVAATGQGLCTYGANVKYNGVPAFITNTHCSAQPASVDATPYHQGGTIIGTEIADPPFTYCYPYNCRYSDAVVVQLNGAKTGELGTIARTRFFDSYPPDGGVGDTIIDDAQPRFPLIWPGYNTNNPVIGEQIQKVGRITGWIQGPINKTCFDRAGNDGFIRRCTHRFNGEVDQGDSGSPVFFRLVCPGDTYPLMNCASWAGIVWGESAGQVYYSPASGLFRDFPGSFEFANP